MTVTWAAAVLLSATRGSCTGGLLLQEEAVWDRGLCCSLSLGLGCSAWVLGALGPLGAAVRLLLLVCVDSAEVTLLQEETSVSANSCSHFNVDNKRCIYMLQESFWTVAVWLFPASLSVFLNPHFCWMKQWLDLCHFVWQLQVCWSIS